MLKDEIKILLLEIDALVDATNDFKDWSKQIEQAKDNLLFAKAWLGKTLGVLGEDTPYKNDGKRKVVEDIEPVANKTDNVIQLVGNHIENVDSMREHIEVILTKLIEFKEVNGKLMPYKGNIYTTESFSDLTRAKMWLGFELGRIRDAYIKDN